MKTEIEQALETLRQNGVSLETITEHLKEEVEEKMNYFVYGIGNEGVEGVLDLQKETNSLNSFKLRCRFNGHRNIKIYGVKTSVSREDLWSALESKDAKTLKTIFEKSIKIGY